MLGSMSAWRLLRCACALAALVPLACDDGGLTGVPPAPLGAPTLGEVNASTLLWCPTREGAEAKGVIGPSGGTISVRGHSVTLPPGAVDVPTEIRLKVPTSDYLEIELRADVERFANSVSVTVSYQRCNDPSLQDRTLTAWHIDERTGDAALLGGANDPSLQTVTFIADRFSIFALAN